MLNSDLENIRSPCSSLLLIRTPITSHKFNFSNKLELHIPMIDDIVTDVFNCKFEESGGERK